MNRVNGMISLGDELMLINTTSNLTHNLDIDNSSIRINPTTDLDSITGLISPTGNVGGELLLITNPHSFNSIILLHNNSGSLSKNRIFSVTGNNIRIPPKKTILLKYVNDNTTPGWWTLPGAETNFRYGSTVINANGSTSVFTIPHGLGYTPISLSITLGDARDLDLLNSLKTVDATNITITCDNPPVPSSNIIYWQVFG